MNTDTETQTVKKWYKRWWGISLIIFGILVVLSAATSSEESVDKYAGEPAIVELATDPTPTTVATVPTSTTAPTVTAPPVTAPPATAPRPAAPPVTAAPRPVSKACGADWSRFNAVQPGMTYAQVDSIMGCTGTVTLEMDTLRAIKWNEIDGYGFATIYFESGTVDPSDKGIAMFVG
ncbi:hypothetical protein UFOVP1305_77 [uncultured Caudovirales phage]|uniref:Uncharacterized protein n=1 Tax=uncultured Caudovirales phage TaxID=2100421 RepID=A0A6J5PE96_9CAUD|nr:hypothetical protein UFOVP896_22 [uncultured Caudovirales phage]CAB4198378.1 hypothetical protein UFOVP1305_77 [uncultured Caudovirales phage]